MNKKQVYNPYLPLDEYIPDGEPHVFGDRVYLYGSHDKEGGHTFCMEDYTVYSAPVNDLSLWRREGVIYRAEQDPDHAERPYMYAPDVVRGNDGKYYLYYCMSGEYGVGGYFGPISVAVCDTPAGRYEYLGFLRYPDGTPMQDYVCFDPCAFNDDGTVRIYYGTQYMNESNEILASDPEKLAEVCKRFNKLPEEVLGTHDNVNGACMVVLEDDMLTVRERPKHIIPYEADFGGHEFFEASSMRKIGSKYYFVFSSQKNHELCYAVSDFPDRDFVYGGTIVSNGDVGLNGITDENRLNMTGTTHGSIIEINGQWYVFYHRLTHKSDYSRQACAERITVEPDGSIKQVEITSCGLNGKPLEGKGTYPAIIACNITNGKMPHGSNKIFTESFPNVTNCGEERYIGEISSGTLIGFKYFEFENTERIGIVFRNEKNCSDSGRFLVYFSNPYGAPTAEIVLPSGCMDWTESFAEISVPKGKMPLFLVYKGESIVSLKEIIFL